MKLAELKNKKNILTDIGEKTFAENYDVIVAGLGTAGAIAVIAAGRHGLKTLGVEKLTCMGGSATSGAISAYYYGLPGGLFEEIDEKAGRIQTGNLTQTGNFHPDAKKFALESEAVKAGVKLAYNSAVTGIFLEGKKVTGIRWISQDGIKETGCKILVDATGDGEACAIAGCEFSYGRKFDGTSQPYSNVWITFGAGRNIINNLDAGYIDPTDGDDISARIIESGSLRLKNKFKENGKFISTAPQLGQREGRLIKGEATLNFQDFLLGKSSEKPLFYEYTNYDTHSHDWAFESEITQDWVVVAGLWGIPFSIPVPLKTMLPERFDGLMMAGRCMSMDHEMAQCLRMQKAMQKSGEAAALAASLAIKKNISLRDIPYHELLEGLKATGCFNEKIIDNKWFTDKNTIKIQLASEKPGFAIWSAKLLGEKVRKELKEWILSDDENLSKHSAFALGLLLDSTALPVLRKIVRERDEFVPATSCARNQKRLCSALYLLGKLEDIESREELFGILREYKEFDIFSHAFMSLLKIGSAFPGSRKKIADEIIQEISSGDFSLEYTIDENLQVKEVMTGYIRITAAREFDRWGIPHSLDQVIEKSELTMREKALLNTK